MDRPAGWVATMTGLTPRRILRRSVSGRVESGELVSGSGLPRHEAERLLRGVAGAPRAALVGGLRMDDVQAGRFHRLVERRLAGEPLQYLEGTVQFGPVELDVDRRVLIPRPETEQLWERAMGLLFDGPCVVVDMGTGSGCLALAIKYGRPDVRVMATEISAEALAVARSNATRSGLELEFYLGDRLDALDRSVRGTVSMIVTNPPYVSEREWQDLPVDVRDHEPKVALALGDGVDMYRYLASEAAPWLTQSGVLAAEIGETQGQEVQGLFEGLGWQAEIGRDWTGRDRFLVARRDR